MYDSRKRGKEHVFLQKAPSVTNQEVQHQCLKAGHRATGHIALPTLGCWWRVSPICSNYLGLRGLFVCLF